jgi:hypothetical protein
MDFLVSEDFSEYFRFVVTAIAGAAAFIWANRRDALDLKELGVLSGLRASYKDAEDQSPVHYIDKRVTEILYKPDDYSKKKMGWWTFSLVISALVFAASLIVAAAPGWFPSWLTENGWIITGFVVAAIAGVMISVSLSIVRKELDKKKRKASSGSNS